MTDKAVTLGKLKQVGKLMDGGQPDEAWDILQEILYDDPNDPRALIAAADIHEKARRWIVAYQFAERAVHIAPNIFGPWLIFGRMAHHLYRLEDAEMAYRKALDIAPDASSKAAAQMNLSGLCLDAQRWEEAETFARDSLKLKDSWKNRGNLGMALLAQRKWKEGWEYYDAIVGSEHRRNVKYGDEPTWTGEKNKVVAVPGEQGVGDEVMFASMFPDLIKDSKKVILDCDAKLKGLFQRSFPQAKVYGTRSAKEVDGTKWDPEDHQVDASITSGALGKYYRLNSEDFPGSPYLIPDPDRVMMWKALFDKQRPTIGIAWSGGMPWTASRFRRWSLPELMPLFRSAPAHWVSLQYKDASKEIDEFNSSQRAVRVTQYPYGTLTKDYDDTAALVASLDLVICMQTAVAHLAGAMGKECWVFIPTYGQWRYGQGEDVPWYKSVKVWRQRPDGSWPLEEAAKLLSLRYARAA
jgi:hypothetical protein